MRIRIALAVCVLVPSIAGAPGARADGVEYVMPPRPVCCSNGMTLNGDTLYVNHAALDAVSLIDVDARTVTSMAGEGDDPADELVTPDDVWRDPQTGDLYITEILTNGVRRIAPDGTRTRVMAGFGDGVAHPNAITGLRRPGQPLRLFISMVQFEPGSRTGIWEVDPLGVVPPRLVYGAAGGRNVIGEGMRAPNAFAFDPAGKELYVPESYGGAVWAVDVDAGTARRVYDGRDAKANGIALRFARDGSILYAEQDSGRLLRLDPGGPATQTPEVVAQLDPGIDGIAEHEDGRIFLSNFRYGGISIVRRDRAIEQMFPRSMDLPNGIDARFDGTLAIGDLGSVALVDPADPPAVPERPKQFIRDDFDIAVGVFASGCDVYATGFFRATLQRFDACDPSKPHAEILPRRTFGLPWDIALGDGPLYVSDAAGLVWRIAGWDNPSGASAAPLIAGLNSPTGIAVAPASVYPPENRSLYVSESGAGQVRRFSILGATGGLVAQPDGAIAGFVEPEGVFVSDGWVYVVDAGTGELIRVKGDRREVLATGLATGIRGVSIAPQLNFFADVTVIGDHAYVTTPLDGAIVRVPIPG